MKNSPIRMLLAICATTAVSVLSIPAAALTFDVTFTDNGPIFEPMLWVDMSGPVENGDTDKFRAAIAPYLDRNIYEIVIVMDSPGGSLTEGMRLGRAISELPFISSASVGVDGGDNICASACVNVYLGADYRFLDSDARIGIHQFSLNQSMDATEALILSQNLSAEIVAYIREMRADPEFFSLMVLAHPEEIYWVPRSILEDLRVVTYGIFSETAEYRNVSGSVALHLQQVGRYGTNRMTLLCGDKGMVAIFDLNEPEVARAEQLEIFIDGETFSLSDLSSVYRENYRLVVTSLIPIDILNRLVSAREIGGRVTSPESGIFFGFEQGVRDPKIAETAKGCLSQMKSSAPQMTRVDGIDFTGGDLAQTGYRNISFAQCQQICLRSKLCVAVSYHSAKRWCWPKGAIVNVIRNSSIISAYFE